MGTDRPGGSAAATGADRALVAPLAPVLVWLVVARDAGSLGRGAAEGGIGQGCHHRSPTTLSPPAASHRHRWLCRERRGARYTLMPPTLHLAYDGLNSCAHGVWPRTTDWRRNPSPGGAEAASRCRLGVYGS